MKNPILTVMPFAFVEAVAVATPARANEKSSARGLSVGGLVFTKSADVSMEYGRTDHRSRCGDVG